MWPPGLQPLPLPRPVHGKVRALSQLAPGFVGHAQVPSLPALLAPVRLYCILASSAACHGMCGATAHAGHNASSCAPLGRVSRLQKGSERNLWEEGERCGARFSLASVWGRRQRAVLAACSICVLGSAWLQPLHHALLFSLRPPKAAAFGRPAAEPADRLLCCGCAVQRTALLSLLSLGVILGSVTTKVPAKMCSSLCSEGRGPGPAPVGPRARSRFPQEAVLGLRTVCSRRRALGLPAWVWAPEGLGEGSSSGGSWGPFLALFWPRPPVQPAGSRASLGRPSRVCEASSGLCFGAPTSLRPASDLSSCTVGLCGEAKRES